MPAPKLSASAGSYFAWRQRPCSECARADVLLADRIRWIHLHRRGTHGAQRIHAELVDQGMRVARKRVSRLMRAACLQGVSRRIPSWTTIWQAGAGPAPDLVKWDFAVAGMNRLLRTGDHLRRDLVWAAVLGRCRGCLPAPVAQTQVEPASDGSVHGQPPPAQRVGGGGSPNGAPTAAPSQGDLRHRPRKPTNLDRPRVPVLKSECACLHGIGP